MYIHQNQVARVLLQSRQDFKPVAENPNNNSKNSMSCVYLKIKKIRAHRPGGSFFCP